MSDQKLGLPVRTEADADERLQIKVVDATTVGQQMEVDTDGNAHAEMHANNPAGADTVVRVSELGAPNPDGDYDVSNNTKPASVGMVAHDRNATPGETHQNKRVTAVQNGDVTAIDAAIRDESGVPYSQNNPFPVSIEESEGDEVADYDQGVAIASDATSEHTYSVADGRTLVIESILCSASVRAKYELQIGDGAASETFAPKAVAFSTTANPNAPIELKKKIVVVGTVNTTTVKVIRTNTDNQAQDLYSTILGVERDT